MRDIIWGGNNINLDDGVIFGRGAFETVLIKEKPIFLKEHIDRLNNAINVLKIGESVDVNDILIKIKELKITNKALKILVTEKNIILLERNIAYTKEDYNDGFKLKLSSVIRNSTSILTYIKSTNYIENLIENQKAKEKGYNEVIFLNEKGFVTEGSTSNVFIVKKGKIITPGVESGLLDGILRNFIINNFEVIEKEITLSELLDSDEVFITNSIVGIMKVILFEDRIYDECDICNKIILRYKKYIAEYGGYTNGR